MVLVTLLWGAAFPLVKWVLDTFALSPFTFAGIRALMSFVGFALAYILIRPQRGSVAWWVILVAGFLAGPGYFLSLKIAESRIPASLASFMAATNSIWTLLFEYFLIKRKVRPMQLFGAVAGMSGLLLLMDVRLSSWSPYLLIGMIPPISWGLYAAITRVHTKKVSSLYWLLTTNLVGQGLMVPLALTSPINLNLAGWAVVFMLAILSSVYGQIVWVNLVKQAGAFEAGSYTILNPLWAYIISYFLLGERLGGPRLMGGLLVVIGVFLINRGTIAEQAQ